jgi:hypothetical protein
VGTPASLEYFHYFKPKEPGKVDYYTMYVGSMSGGRALVSSTLTMGNTKVSGLNNIAPAKFEVLAPLELSTA